MEDLTVSGVGKSAAEADAYATINQFLQRRRRTRGGRYYDPTPTHEKPKIETSESGEVYLRTVDPTTGGFKFTLAGQDPTKKVEDKAVTAYSNYQSTVMAELGGDFGEGNIAFDKDMGGVFYRGTKKLEPHDKDRIKNLNEIGIALKNYTKAGSSVHEPTVTNLMKAMDVNLRGKDVTYTESYEGPEGETVSYETIKNMYPGQTVKKGFKQADKKDEVVDYAASHVSALITIGESEGLFFNAETGLFDVPVGDSNKEYQADETNQTLTSLRNLKGQARSRAGGIADKLRDKGLGVLEPGVVAVETETEKDGVITRQRKYVPKVVDEYIQSKTVRQPAKKLKKVQASNEKLAESHLGTAKSLFEKGNLKKSEDTYRAYLKQHATNEQYKKDNTKYTGKFAVSPRHLPPYTSSQLKNSKAWMDYTSEIGGSYSNIYKQWQGGEFDDESNVSQTEENAKTAFKKGFFEWLQEQQLLGSEYASDFIIATVPTEWTVTDTGYQSRHIMPNK